MDQTAQSDFWCSEVSAASGEQLIATAPVARTWILVEAGGKWERMAYEGSDLPAEVKAHLDAATAGMPGPVKVQLVRDDQTRDRSERSLFMIFPASDDPAIFRFDLSSYEDALAVDLGKVAARDPVYAGNRFAGPLVTVCTHGRRDRCCARNGIALYEPLRAALGDRVWQSSHIGSHRFAANVVHFPFAYVYGRLGPGDVEQFSDRVNSKQVYLDRLRGSSNLDEAAQAAEYFLRRETGITAIDALRVSAGDHTGGDQPVISFAGQDGTAYRVAVRIEKDAYEGFMSCGDANPKKADRYELVSIDS